MVTTAAPSADLASDPRAALAADLPAAQQPSWPDEAALADVVVTLETYPPLVFAGECDDLRDRMAAISGEFAVDGSPGTGTTIRARVAP